MEPHEHLLLDLMDQAEKEHPFVKEGLFKWGSNFAAHCERCQPPAHFVAEHQELIESIFKFRDPEMRIKLNAVLFKDINRDWGEFWSGLTDKTRKNHQIAGLLLYEAGRENFETSRLLLHTFSKSFEKDKLKMKWHIQFCYHLSQAAPEERRAVFTLLQREVIECLGDKSRKEEGLGALKTLNELLKFGFGECLKQVETIEELNVAMTALVKREIGAEHEQFAKTLGTFRNQNALLTYARGLKTLNSPETLRNYQKFITSVLNGTFIEERYQIPHLKVIFQKYPVLELIWRHNISRTLNELTVLETDDPRDLFAVGDEVLGSSQRTDGKPSLNRGLIGYLLNGYTKVAAVKERSGRIAGRSMIRLLWDKKNERPVLYQELYYQSNPNPQIRSLVREICLEKARSLGVALVGASGDRPYPEEIHALGGVADEYIDAIGGVYPSTFVIPRCFIIALN